MQKKIYFNAKTLYLTSETTPEIEDYLHRRETIFIDELDPHAVRTMIQAMQQDEFHQGVFLHPNPESVLEGFKKEMETIQAGGGFVYTPGQQLLLIFRRGKWDLPKGKRDEGEDLAACALREVQEETGISAPELESFLCTTYHTYHQDGKHYLKESLWYSMKAEEQKLKPQKEEDIEKCIWAPFKDLGIYMDLTHASIKDVVKTGLKKHLNRS